MKDKVYYRSFAWPHSMLSMKHSGKDEPHFSGSGFYIHSSGYAVRIYYDDGFGRHESSTSLDMNFGGISYSKTINRIYSERGLQLLCARFISDVLSGKIDRLVKEQKKK